MRHFTAKERQTFEQVCSLKQTGVLHLLKQYLKVKYGDNVISTPSYVVAIGDIPVALVAHADTVFKNPPKEFFYDEVKNVMWSPDGLGADDRAGIFAIMKIIALGQRPHIIITTDEESGCIGANKLVGKMKSFPAPLKFMIQLDRRGHNDAVYYDCGNAEFESFITPFGFITQYGSFTDISILAPAWDVAAVNLSVGYFDEHSVSEHLYIDSLFNTIDKVQTILQKVVIDSTVPFFDYKELPVSRWWQDDGYNLYEYGCIPLEEGEEYCSFCGDPERKENLLPLKWHGFDGVEAHICNACYAHSANQIEWCNKCNQGYFLSENDLKNMPQDRTKWVCKNCREGQSK